MNSPNPVPHPSVPSSSTVVSVAIGAPVAVLAAWLLKAFAHIDMPAEASAALGTVVSALVGYFANGGRAVDTQ